MIHVALRITRDAWIREKWRADQLVEAVHVLEEEIKDHKLVTMKLLWKLEETE